MRAGAATQVLVETVQRLWPDATSVAPRRDRGGRATDGVRRLTLVPDARAPRLLAPDDRRAASHAVQRYSAALTPREAVLRVLLGAAVRVADRWVLPDRIEITGGSGDDIVAHLGEVLGEPVSVSLGVGTARANRKPVLGVFDRRGRPIAFAKIGDTPIATAHVTGEASALRRIGTVSWRIVRPPALLHSDRWRDVHVLVMTALPARPWQGRNSEWNVPDDALAELGAAFAERPTPLASTAMWRECRASRRRLRDAPTAERFALAIEAAERRHGGVEVAVGAWHGDFAPWNLARRNGVVQLWDWERFATGVPIGLDRLHFGVQTHTRRNGFTPATIDDGLVRGGATLPASRLAALRMAYLASLAGRYLVAAQDEGGHVLEDKSATVLAALEQEVVR